MTNLTITLIQTELFWENPSQNRAMLEKKINTIEKSTDLIVLPEMFTTGFTMNSKKMAETMNGVTINWMQQQAAKKNCTLTGSIIIEENKNYYNRLLWVAPNGVVQYYDKKHLFRMANENKYFASGTSQLIVTLKGWNICPLICYDLRFPVWSRNVNKNYDCLLYIANWPQPRQQAWSSLLEARAHENQCYVIGVNRVGKDIKENQYSGNSVVISPKGEKLTTIAPFNNTVETITLSKKELNNFREKFPVNLDADNFQV